MLFEACETGQIFQLECWNIFYYNKNNFEHLNGVHFYTFLFH